MPRAEFDLYANDYTAGCDVALKGLLGPSPDDYLKVKVDLLISYLENTGRRETDTALRYLDFGCGTGDFLHLLLERPIGWQIEGCDVSDGMLRGAEARHPELAGRVRLWNCDEQSLPTERYDLITVTCVLHHVHPGRLQQTLNELADAVRPGGLLCVFEHNPWNPVTRFVVARTPIDKNAVLISPTNLKRMVQAPSMQEVRVRHFMFFPPRIGFLTRIERRLSRAPLGGQYLLTAEKAR